MITASSAAGLPQRMHRMSAAGKVTAKESQINNPQM
jgi:hypothetical protein